MGNSARQFTGWRIAEAMRRCADSDLLSAWFVDHRTWRGAGSRRRFSFHSEYLGGHEAAGRNQSEGALRKISVQSDGSYARLKTSLIEHLLAERIVAWGRRETPTASSMAIPGSAWKHIHISDVRKSVVREKTHAKTKIFDLWIFPIVESPDAIERLKDKTLVEAFRMSLVDDPQLNVLRKRAIAGGGTPASFGNECLPQRVIWPVVLDQGSDVAPVIGFTGRIVTAANRIQRERYLKLMDHLSTGRLVAEGTSAADGKSVTIPRSIWKQDDIYVDLERGNLLEIDPKMEDRSNHSLKLFLTELILRKAEAVSPSTATYQKGPKSIQNVQTKMSSRTACRKWLVGIMNSSRTNKLGVREDYWLQASSKWPNSLSKRAFLAVWTEAAVETEAYVWSAGGAPKKPPHRKPMHQ